VETDTNTPSVQIRVIATGPQESASVFQDMKGRHVVVSLAQTIALVMAHVNT